MSTTLTPELQNLFRRFGKAFNACDIDGILGCVTPDFCWIMARGPEAPHGRIVTGRSFVAFGPYLCIAAYIVLCTWRMLWEGIQLKIIFSHWPTVAGMVAGSFVAFCLLLVGLRIFRAMPAELLR